MADKELLKKYHLEEAVKRFNQINEYTFISAPIISEEGEDEEPQDNVENGGNEGNNGGEQPTQQAQPTQQPPQPQNPQPSNAPNKEQAPIPQAPQFGAEGDVSAQDFDVAQEGDEVIDVDDLTQSQESTEEKVDMMNQELSRLLNVLGKLTNAIDASDEKINQLKAEFEKRNPTEEEKLNIRSQSSYPYSEMPRDYWEKKQEENPHYNAMFDNNVSPNDEQEKFEIRRSDLNNFSTKDISDSFDDALKLADFFGL